MTLPLTDTLLHSLGYVEAREASYKNQVFLSYVINTQTNTISVSTIRTVKASRGQGLAKGALQWLCDLADAKNSEIKLVAKPADGLNATNLVNLFSTFGFRPMGIVHGYKTLVRSRPS